MVLRLPAACLASLAFIDQPALGFIALNPPHSIGVRPRQFHADGPTVRYQSRLDLGQPSVDLALLGLNITCGISASKSRRGGDFVAGGSEQAIFRLHERRIRYGPELTPGSRHLSSTLDDDIIVQLTRLAHLMDICCQTKILVIVIKRWSTCVRLVSVPSTIVVTFFFVTPSLQQ